MRLIEIIQVIKLMPRSMSHLRNVIKILHLLPYNKVLKEPFNSDQSSGLSIHVIVKSYFWASRLIWNCRCLPRSIAIFQNLKSEGYEVEHKIGVNKKDRTIEAHAWVEYKHEPLNESKYLKQRFKVMERPNESLK